MRYRRLAGSAVVVSLVVMMSGCSGASQSSSSSAPAPASSGTSASTSSASAAHGTPSAASVWSAVVQRISSLRTVHLHEWFGSDTGSPGAATIVTDMDVTLDGTRQHGTQTLPPDPIEILTIDGRYWEKYPTTALRNLAGHDDRAAQDALVARVGGRWVELSDKAKSTPKTGPVRAVLNLIEPGHSASAAFRRSGSHVEATSFKGRNVWKLRSADGKERAWVTRDAPYDVLRWEHTGTGTLDTSETLELTKPDVPFTVTAPTDAVPYSVIEEAMDASLRRR